MALAAALVAVAAVLFALLHKSSHAKPKGPAIVKVVVPEGKTRAQIAEIAKHAGLRGDYRTASRSSALLDPRRYGAPSSTRTLEGFLFPATYDEFVGAPASRLVAEQLEAFKENFNSEIAARAKALGETPYQLLTVASMVEREAEIPEDRAKIAAVIYNRIKRGMPLGIDATIYYAIEQRSGVATYTRELTESQLRMNSAYNTRTHVGLPPTPISNPGLASIEAASKPASVAYLYYVAGADGCGEHVFSDTEAEFEANDAAYKAALAKNGGKLPKCKK
ncbi:MAG TPA: endolytic transglycosylase MltG [Solirubrobacteraceae bacterium]|nr:endolytic transglycosylase MltG [Solirubrobacteraceae bacterium]